MNDDGRLIYEIAGAGPAGLTAAIALAQAGRQVVVHEARPTVGYRFGGDFQGLENWTTEDDVLAIMARMKLTTDFSALPCHRGTVYDDRRRAYAIRSDEPLFYLIERGPGPDSLDSALLRQATSLGVDVRFNSRLDKMAGQGILAVGPKAADAIAVGYHFETDMADGFWVICDDNLAPQGYAYLLVMNGKGNLKTCMFSDFRHEKDYLERTVDAFQTLLGVDMIDARAHGGSGNFRIPDTACAGGHPLVGEQAGFQDTLWGFGIRLAMSSGLLAARSLLTGEDYDRLWRQQLLPQMQTSVVNRVLFARLGNRGYRWFLRHFSGRLNLRAALRWHYLPSWPKSMLMPWARKRYRSQRKDLLCQHRDCHCVYCRGQSC